MVLEVGRWRDGKAQMHQTPWGRGIGRKVHLPRRARQRMCSDPCSNYKAGCIRIISLDRRHDLLGRAVYDHRRAFELPCARRCVGLGVTQARNREGT